MKRLRKDACEALIPAIMFMVLMASAGQPALGVTIDIGSASAAPGSTVEIPVSMSTGPGELVVAVQNNIAFDDSVLSVGRGSCRINPNIGPGSLADKTLSSNLRSPSVLTAIVISIGNTNPIPPGILYSCAFQVRSDAPAGSLLLENSAMVASDPNARRLAVSGASGTIFVAGEEGSQADRQRQQPAQGQRVQPRSLGQPAAPGAPKALGAPPLPRSRGETPAEKIEDWGEGASIGQTPVRRDTEPEATAEPTQVLTPTAQPTMPRRTPSVTPGTMTAAPSPVTTPTVAASGTKATATAVKATATATRAKTAAKR